MTNSWRFIPFSVHRGAENMAIDEILLLNKRSGKKSIPNTLRFYGWSPGCCSIGIHQDLEAEVNIEAVKKAGKDFVRRISGGGAVYHDSAGELTYSIVVDAQDNDLDSVDASFIHLSSWIVAGLSRIGMDLAHDKIHCPSLFTSSKKKISGNAQCRKGKYILQHGTILLKYDPSEMYTYLRVKEGITKDKMVKSVYAHVTTLEEETGKTFHPEEVIPYLKEAFERQFKTELVESKLTEEELRKAKQLSQVKYSKNDWNYRGLLSSR
ncbi:MAG: biotin/lipoate A/B protein ligase family protein [Candidatus Odinarchaeota archaeon]